jgi:hypothetical protein
MQKDKFDRIISFLLGASWAIVILDEAKKQTELLEKIYSGQTT